MNRTEIITFRTDRNTKNEIERMAAERKWSRSLLIEEIIKAFLAAQISHQEIATSLRSSQ